MTDERHRIEKAEFEISFASPEELLERQPRLESLLKRTLLPVVDEVFQEFSRPNTVFSIERLEVDLGTLDYEDFEIEMPRRLREHLRRILRDRLKHATAKPSPAGHAGGTVVSDFDVLEQFLMAGYLPGDRDFAKSRTIDHILRQLLHSRGDRLISFLKRLPRRKTVLKRLIAQFPEEVLIDILRVLAPSDPDRLAAIVNDFESSSGRRWEQLLDELLENGVASPDGKGIATVLPDRPDADRESAALIRGYELYEALWEGLVGGVRRGGAGLEAVIAELQREHPEQLLRLFRELQAGEYEPGRARAGLGEQELRALVRAVLGLTVPGGMVSPGSDGAHELARAVEAYAERSSDRAGYYAEVLERLVRGVWLDFEEITARVAERERQVAGEVSEEEPEVERLPAAEEEPEVERLPAGEEKPEVERLPAGEEEPEVGRLPASEGEGSVEAAVLRYLKGEEAPQGSRGGWVRELERMMAGKPERSRQWLEPVLGNGERAGRLIELLPERLLTRVLLIMRPEVHAAAQSVAEAIAGAAYRVKGGDRPARIRQLKWRYIFRYLFEESRTYREADFVKRFAGYLAEQTGPPDRKEFVRMLGMQLGIDVLPGMRERNRRIIDALPETAEASLPPEAERESGALIRGYELYEALWEGLVGGVRRRGEGLEPVIGELQREHPQQLLRLFRELQSGEYEPERARAGLGAQELGALVRAVLGLTVPGSSGGPGSDAAQELLRAVEAYAERSSDRASYYVGVLERLVRGELLDFEQITTRAGERERQVAGEVIETEPEVEELPAGKEGPEVERLPAGEEEPEVERLPAAEEEPEVERLPVDDEEGSVEAAVLRYLKGEEAAESSRGGWVQELERMMAGKPERSRQWLDPVLENGESAGRLIELLPERLLTRVLLMMRPEVHAGLQGVADAIAGAAYRVKGGERPARIRQLKWRYIFRYLFEESRTYGEADFAKRFAGYLAGQTGRPDREEFVRMLGMQLGIDVLPGMGERNRRIIDALPGTAEASRSPEANRESAALIRGYELYEALREGLAGRVRRRGEGLQPLIGELRREHPEQLLRLFRELQAGEYEPERARAGLGAQELGALVRAVLALTVPGGRGDDGAPELARAVEAYAERSRDRAGYYAEVLERLVRGVLLDFEEITARAETERQVAGEVVVGAEPEVERLLAHEEEPEVEELPAVEAAGSVEAAIQMYLKGEEASEGRRGGWVRELERLMAGKPERSRQWLEPLLGNGERGARLIELLPERLLTRVLLMMRPEVHAGLQRVADMIAGAAYRVKGGERPARIRQLKWRYIFRYLFEESRTYREADFAKRFAGYLAEQTGQPDREEFVRMLGMQLGIDVLPGMQDRYRRIIESLPGTAEASLAPEADRESAALIRGYELYEALQEGLVGGVRSGGEGLEPVIGELQREHPQQLLRLFRELQAGEYEPERARAGLGAQELGALVRAVLGLAIPGGSGGDGAQELARAVEAYAERSRDRAGYYAEVLECLVRGVLLDFEEIAVRAEQTGRQVAREVVEAKPEVEELRAAEAEGSVEAAVLRYLKGEKAPEASRGGWVRELERTMSGKPERSRQWLEPVLGNGERAGRLIELLPERLLTRVLLMMRPEVHAGLQRVADAIAGAAYRVKGGERPARIRQLKWRYIFRYLFEESRTYREADFVKRFAGYLAEQTGQPDREEFVRTLGMQLGIDVLPGMQERNRRIIDALPGAAETSRPDAGWQPDSGRQPGSGRETRPSADRRYREERSGHRVDGEIQVANAGQVLAAPYLPRLFDMLGLTGNSAFKSPETAERAIHLLQFMVNGSTESPEYELVLNKILCGVRTETPIARRIDISETETEAVEGLLRAITQNWRKLGNTSIAGLRESFLQRDGVLRQKTDAWLLEVKPRPFDMLLDHIPWGFSIIRYPWMERVVHVEWR